MPKEHGGAGVSNVTLAKVIALIAQADASLGQIPQNHFYALEVLRVNGSPAQQKRLYAEVLAGQRFGNALAELGTKTAHDRVTKITRDGDGFRITGRKFYATRARSGNSALSCGGRFSGIQSPDNSARRKLCSGRGSACR